MFDELLKVKCFVIFKPLHRCCGQCIYSSHEVRIDYKTKHNIAKVFLHELIHLARKNWKEPRVLYWEHRLWKTLTHEQVECLYQKLYRDAHKRRAE